MEIKFFKKQKNIKKERFEIRPSLYWNYILWVILILFISSFIFGFYLFMKINNELVPPVININEQETIKKEKLDRALEYFKEREEKSIEILNSPSPIIDPSL